MKTYDLLIIGATFTGIGACYGSSDSCLIVESKAQIGYEFIDSYNYGTDWQNTVVTGKIAALKTELIHRKILSDEGLVHLPALAPVLYNQVKKDKIPVLLLTNVIKIEKKEDLFEVSLFNAGGHTAIQARKILDTRCEQKYIQSKTINAQLYNKFSEEFDFASTSDATFVKGKCKGEIVLKYKLDIADDFIQARHKLYTFWKNRPSALKNWTIASTARYFEVTASNKFIKNDENHFTFISAAYKNPLEAMEVGFNFTKGDD